jgi:amino acid transporter
MSGVRRDRVSTGTSATEESAAPEEGRLTRGLGSVDATMLVAGSIIGSGIFLVPGLVAAEVGTPGMSLLVWVVCGLLATCGALCFAELAAAIPRTGGTYPFLKQAYRQPALPFLYAWSMLFVVYTGAMAAVATAFSIYAGYFLGGWIPYTAGAQRLVAVACIVFLGAMNVVGVQVGGRIQTVFTLAKVGALVGIIVAGFALGTGGTERFTPFIPADAAGLDALSAFGTAMILGLFAYNGWWMSSFVAGEVREPQRTIPKSIFFGMAIVLCVYLLANAAYLYVLPFEDLQGSATVAADAMVRVTGPVGGSLVAAAVMISTFGTVNAQMLAYPRIYFALGEDNGVLRCLSSVHGRFRTPAVAIIVQTTWASVLALSGTYQQIVTYAAFPNYLFLGLAVAGVIILRRTAPNLPRPYRAWGYPVTPLVFLAVLGWYLANSIVYRLEETLIGVLLMLSGLPVYALWRWRQRRAALSTAP